MENMDLVVGQLHSRITQMMRKHVEGVLEVTPQQQRDYLIQEMNEALFEVREWIGQQELLQIDANSFHKAVDRLIRAQVSIVKNVITEKETQIMIAKQIQSWGRNCNTFVDIFLPRQEEKWKTVNTHEMEDNIFFELEDLQQLLENCLK
eukprot:TRINITY_DN1588_c0_g2_i1.p1 TRINITY_DN1588_c0_g2~~TRINITY_DN1588_c0_g2_i1.p1  ORF type:complete len:149 (+),score=31.24 TRINITY_DN1588_c0_g2_i1:406-852(+)